MAYLIIILCVLLIDLTIKYFVEKKGKETDDKPICHGAFYIRKHHNKGVVLNVGSQKRKVVAVISTTFTIIMTIVFIVTLSTKGKTLLKTGLALILGGAYSNTYDRLRRKYVVDYVSLGVKWKALRNIVFNIGDFGIIIGSLFLIISES